MVKTLVIKIYKTFPKLHLWQW